MIPIKKLTIVMSVVAVLLPFAACGPVSKSLNNYRTTANTSGLVLDQSQAPTLVYRRPSASLASYNRFIVDPVRVEYRDPKMKELKPEDIARMQTEFHSRIVAQLHDGGYSVVTRSEPGTMRISMTISGLEASDMGGKANMAVMATGMAVGMPSFAVSVGKVTVEAVFKDAVSNRIEAVVVDRSQGRRVLNKKPWSTWADVEFSFDKWAEGLRTAIDAAHYN